VKEKYQLLNMKEADKNLKIKKFIFSKLIIIIILILFRLFFRKIKKNIIIKYFKKNIKISNKLVSTKQYDDFDFIKYKYSNDSIINPYLERISIICHIYNKNYKQIKKKKNNIHICAGLTNEYIYPLLVLIESILVNCNKLKTFIIYHILCSPNFTENNILILKSLMNQYSSNIEMIFYNMSNNFMNLNNKRFTQAAYYRILIPIIVDIDRILYFDADALVLKDLNEMYQAKFNDNYILGTLDYLSKGIDYLGIKSEKFINSGVLLLNLKKIKKDNKIYELLNIINNKTILRGHDQALINYAFYPKIGIMPIKYNKYLLF
jgi:hypothetical protein